MINKKILTAEELEEISNKKMTRRTLAENEINTTIQVLITTREDLKKKKEKIGSKGETYDSIIQRLLVFWNKSNKKHGTA
jgi:hypothetical protein